MKNTRHNELKSNKLIIILISIYQFIKTIYRLLIRKYNIIYIGLFPLLSIRFLLSSLSLSVMSIFVLVRFNQITDSSPFTRFLFFIFLFTPTLVYIFLLYNSLKERKSNSSKSINEIQNKLFGNYIQILLFLSGCFIAIEYLKEPNNALNIPSMYAGTVGFRSWNAEVKIRDIEIRYLDEDKKWLKVDDIIVQNIENWKGPIRPYKDVNFPVNFIKYVVSDSGRLEILLKNCGILFQPGNDIFHKFSNVRLTAKVEFISVEDQNPGINFITNSKDVSLTYYDHIVLVKNGPFLYSNKNYYSDEYCLEFVFPFKDYAHPWIPALEWRPGVAKISGQSDLLRIANIGKKKSLGYPYKLQAFVIDNKAVFSALEKDYKGSGLLFEAIIDEESDRKLMPKGVNINY